MSRWIKTFVATSLVLVAHGSAWGWGQPRGVSGNVEELAEKSHASGSFPLNDDQKWYVRESYLLWSPHEDDIDWANRFSLFAPSDVYIDVRLKKPDFGWYSGVRLAAGKYLPHHDHWDISLIASYFYAETKNKSSAHPERGTSLLSTWPPVSTVINHSSGHSTWRLNFFTWDFAIGRDFFLSSKITAHPFCSLRSFLIYEDQIARYSGRQADAIIGTDRAAAVRFKGFNDSWGIGPRIGSDFTFYLNKFWTLMGSLSGAVFLGSYKVSEKIRVLTDDFISQGSANQFYHVSDRGFAIRSNLEASLGMGWERWVREGSVRVAPSIVFEAAQWFDANQWILLRNPAGGDPPRVNYYNTDRHHGDLTFFGFTFNLQVDF